MTLWDLPIFLASFAQRDAATTCNSNRLALMLVLTFAPCACGGLPQQQLTWWCFSLSRWYKDSTYTRSGFTHCNLRHWCLFSTHWRRYWTYTQALCGGYLVIHFIYIEKFVHRWSNWYYAQIKCQWWHDCLHQNLHVWVCDGLVSVPCTC